MTRYCSVFLALAYCLVCASPNSLAQNGHNPEAHTHGQGQGQMTVIYEVGQQHEAGQQHEIGQLQIELITPAANLLGFEHTPNTQAQWQQLNELRQTLNTPDALLTLTPACELQASDLNLPFAEEVPPLHNGADHNVEHHAEHSHPTHHDIHVHYEWRCKGPKPPSIHVPGFKRFSAFEKIQVQWIANNKQGAALLDKNNTALEIK